MARFGTAINERVGQVWFQQHEQDLVRQAAVRLQHRESRIHRLPPYRGAKPPALNLPDQSKPLSRLWWKASCTGPYGPTKDDLTMWLSTSGNNIM